MSKNKKLPRNCEIEIIEAGSRDFRLRFTSDDYQDYVSEVYTTTKGQRIKSAAYEVCAKFGWLKEPPNGPEKIIHNLEEFLTWRGCGQDPYQWARAFYKYTDCGPWAVFLEEISPAHDINHPSLVARIRCVRGKAKVLNIDELDARFISFLGFDEHGLSKQERTWEHYLKLIDEYIADEAKQQRTGRSITIEKRTVAEIHIRQPDRPEHVESEYREIYYEDIGNKGADGKEIDVDFAKCVGIKFGSIVEGSDACSGPFEHLFPFKAKDFEHDLQHMEDETSFYWERANGHHYCVRTEDDEWHVVNCWGAIKWDDEPPEPIKVAAEAAIKNDWQPDPKSTWGGIIQTIPKMPSMYLTPKDSDKEWKAMPLGDTGAEIYTYEDDTTFD